MLVSMLLPSRTAAMLAPLPRCARMTRPAGCRRVAQAREFFHQVGIGQAVETVALHSLRVVAARDGKQLGNTRHGAVKRGVKTGHLRQFRMTLAERLDQLDLAGQMVRVVRADAMQFIQQFLGDQLGRGVLHAVDHTVPHSPDRFETILLFEPIDQKLAADL